MSARRGHFRRHVLVITVDRCPDCKDAPQLCADCIEDPQLDYAIECPGVDDSCRTWWECREMHTDEDRDRMGEEESVHGVVHAWISGLGWATPGSTCYVQTADHMTDAAADVAADVGRKPGRYAVDWDTGDPGDLTLRLLPTGATA